VGYLIALTVSKTVSSGIVATGLNWNITFCATSENMRVQVNPTLQIHSYGRWFWHSTMDCQPV